MKEALEKIEQSAKQALSTAVDVKALEEIRVKYLGKKGEITAILKQMGKLSAEERPKMGQLANKVRADIEDALTNAQALIKAKMREQSLKSETLDVTLPGKKKSLGQLHPLNIVMSEIEEVFMGMGFDIVEGPEIETDHYCFEALNMPKDHPARDTQDTFYIDENTVLRTQTSSVQIRTMEKTADKNNFSWKSIPFGYSGRYSYTDLPSNRGTCY